MNDPKLVFLKEQFDRQTAAWTALKAKFAELPATAARVPAAWLDELNDIAARPRVPQAVPTIFGINLARKV